MTPSADDLVARHHDDAEERVEGHRGEHVAQTSDVRQLVRRAVHANDQAVVHEPDDHKVDIHQLVGPMVP